MSETLQWIIIISILVISATYIVFKLKKKSKKHCNSCDDCPLIDNCKKFSHE